MHQKYKKTLRSGRSRPSTGDSANRVWWSSRHCEQDPGTSDTALAIPTRSSQKFITPYSRIARLGHGAHDRLLHSIPNKKSLGNKQLRCLSYSIPLACMLALFGLFCIASSVGGDGGLIVGEAYAAEGEEKPTYNPSLTMSLSGQICADEEKNIGCEVYGQTVANVGETTYSRAYGVNINGQDMSDYKLTISANNGGALINDGEGDGNSGDGSGGANIPSVASTSGEAMGENTWGYAWFDSVTVSDDEKKGSAYKALSGTQTTLKSEQSIEASEINVDGSLVFAAKFGDEMPSGHYKTEVILSLTASPKKAVADGFGSAYYMQDMTPQVCASVEPGTVGELEDARDHKIYTVARIKNKAGDTTDAGANCWMTQNLQLDLEQYWNAETMTTALSDVPNDNYWSNNNIGSMPTKLGNAGFSSADISIQYTNTTDVSELTIITGSYDSSYGYYYTWCAATVGCKNNSGSNPTAGVDAVASICPKGWQLPSGNVNGQWYNLLNDMDMNSIAVEPYKIPAAGRVNSNGLSFGGEYGYYWSRTASTDYDAYYLRFSSSDFYPGTGNGNRYFGQSVRCVVEVPKGMADITYMQEMTADICKNTPDGWTGSLIDDRDTSRITYTVGKLKDGNCWMTQNLRLPGGTKITNANSDITADSFTVSTYSDSADDTYGAYYAFNVANANTAPSSSGVEAPSSICPRGWKLPLNSGKGSFEMLYNSAANNGWIDADAPGNTWGKAGWMIGGAFFPAAGIAYSVGGKASYLGTEGYYWSHTTFNDGYGYLLHFKAGNGVNLHRYIARANGCSVRCVAVSN